MLMRQVGHLLAAVANQLKRSTSTLHRESKRNNVVLNQPYDAANASWLVQAKQCAPCKINMLAAGSHLFGIVSSLIKRGRVTSANQWQTA